VPSEPKPKTFVAVTAFRYGNRRYFVGEVIDDRRVVDRLLRYGDRFITVKRTKTPAVDTATTDQSTKED
jgi:hypothetical protein